MLHINVPLNKVYEAIKELENIKQWYTTDVVESSDKIKIFKWGEMFLIAKYNEIENEKITWEFIESSMPIESLYMYYELTENEEKTRFRFTHFDFTEKSDFYANQNFSSAKYLERLR